MKEKRYVLVEFPYPSGEGLHMGHAFTFTGGDVYARALRMQGYDVLFPIGYDSFGLPTENYAIRTGRKPQEVTQENTARFRRQMNELEFSFDWDRVVDTSDPEYYQFTQWIFLKLVEAGLAEKREMPINWCPECKTGLANEEVVDGACERCGANAVRRRINQWVVRITDYADELLDGLDRTNFPYHVHAAQRNWIGRSEGAEIRFALSSENRSATSEASRSEKIEVFTTRPDTLWGVSALAVAPEHPLVNAVLSGQVAAETNREVSQTRAMVKEYVAAAAAKSDRERAAGQAAKTGVALGVTAVNPATGEQIPVWIADYVIGSYGTGAVMIVPAHDSRDHEFASQFDLPVLPVIEPPEPWDYSTAAYEGMEGVAVNSGPLDGTSTPDAVEMAIGWLEFKNAGERAVRYHLRDWIFSRQHYWGEPIPMIHCPSCGWVPVPEADLPVRLPEVEKYQPTDTGESPLAALDQWVIVDCPKCGGRARRETDTMPNWAGSDWYFLRYCDPDNQDALAGMDALEKWLPVDVYIGGDEHNTLHLLYSRFIYLFLRDIGAVPASIPEPYAVRLSHGVILAEDGRRMSKSRGNVVAPDTLVQKVGADALRVYLMFMGPFDATLRWNDRAVRGSARFLAKFLRVVRHPRQENAASAETPDSTRAARTVNRAVPAITEDIAAFRFNTAVATLMETVNVVSEEQRDGQEVENEVLGALCRLLAPFAPATAEEGWRLVGDGSVHDQPWPQFVPDLEHREPITIAVQVNGTLRGTLTVSQETSREEIEGRARTAGTTARHIEGKALRRIIFVPNRLVNFVV